MNKPVEFDPMTPISRPEEYSPVQVRSGIIEPTAEDFPKYSQRVPQDPLPILRTVADYDPLRVTIQTSDVCQLACTGCYVKEWTDPNGSIRQSHDRIDAPEDQVGDQIRAMGTKLEDVYYLGVEPTLRPEMVKAVTDVAVDLGATVMSITNGASKIDRYEEAFRDGLEAGNLYKILLSLDSIDPEIHNRLRGKNFAFDRTMDTIKHAITEGDPIKVNVTVWPDNYHTVLKTAERLLKLGVKGFGFHCGSVEGIGESVNTKLRHLDPLAWRALCSKLVEWRDKNKDALESFTLPYIFFTETELAEGIIGDPDAYARYKLHLESKNKGSKTSNPIKVCPALAVPQVYVFSNDGASGNGAVSLCNIHTIGANEKHKDAFFADYDADSKEFVVRQDPEHNELSIMHISQFLCPAREYAVGDQNPSDVNSTELGDLYHGCRYVSTNQFPFADDEFGTDHYSLFEQYYGSWSKLMGLGNKVFADLAEIDSQPIPVSEKIEQVKALRQHYE